MNEGEKRIKLDLVELLLMPLLLSNEIIIRGTDAGETFSLSHEFILTE